MMKEILKRMKKWISLMCMILLLISMVSCGDNTKETTDGKIDGNSSKTTGTVREPMPAYSELGVNNSMATTDGRYIYYTYFDTVTNEGKLCRTDMNGENTEELWNVSNSKFYDLYISDGYLYIGHGRTAERIDIATAPNYFKGKNGSVATEPIVEDTSSSKFNEMALTCTDDEYVYFDYNGIYRVKKDTTGLERIVHGENFMNFYDLKVSDDYLYAYCGDDKTIYRINKDGSNAVKLCKAMESHVICDDYVYYIVSGSGNDYTHNLMKTALDGSETATVATLNDGRGNVTILNALNNKIYYLLQEKMTYTLKVYDVESGENSDICELDNSTEFIDIVDNYIFYEQEQKLMKMNIDGTNKEQVGR